MVYCFGCEFVVFGWFSALVTSWVVLLVYLHWLVLFVFVALVGVCVWWWFVV